MGYSQMLLFLEPSACTNLSTINSIEIIRFTPQQFLREGFHSKKHKHQRYQPVSAKN